MEDKTDLAAFRQEAREWLAQNARPRNENARARMDVAVFHDLPPAEERDLLTQARAWQAKKFAAGYGAITWPRSWGGRGLDKRHVDAFREVEAEFETPRSHELTSVTLDLIAPTLRVLGTNERHQELAKLFLRGDSLCCQLFSEPGAGSDLASLATGARQGPAGTWHATGQKVWSSGAQFADWGLLIARTDEDEQKHAGMTAFMLPLDLPGVEVRPLRQMSGGSSFAEVFLDNVPLDDQLRLGQVGSGWKVALTTLGFEREASNASTGVGGSWSQLEDTVDEVGAWDNPALRQQLADVYMYEQLASIDVQRDRQREAAGEVPGPETSIRKLQWVRQLLRISDAAITALGPKIVADTGEPRTFAWTEHVLGAPGYRIAGGTDEIQRNIIGERVLGLPSGPRVDRDRPWKEIPR